MIALRTSHLWSLLSGLGDKPLIVNAMAVALHKGRLAACFFLDDFAYFPDNRMSDRPSIELPLEIELMPRGFRYHYR